MRKILKKVWKFIWYDNSIWSWIINIIIAFLLVKFLLYPGIGWVFGTGYPVVAVVSGSMVHDNSFNQWWEDHKDFYLNEGMSKGDITSFRNGFNKGDIIVVFGKDPGKIKEGDVIVYEGGEQYPIIHRVIRMWKEEDITFFKTKGDHNSGLQPFEEKINENKLLGRAVFRIPLLGWVKIGFTDIVKKVGVQLR